MTKYEYVQKLLDPRWIEKRDRILERDGMMCRDCYAVSFKIMNVHHLYYGEEPWSVPDEALILLCDDCHKIEHDRFARYVGPNRDLDLRKKGFRAKDYEALCYLEVAVALGMDREDAIANVVLSIERRNKNFEQKLSLIKGYEDEWE